MQVVFVQVYVVQVVEQEQVGIGVFGGSYFVFFEFGEVVDW